MSRREYPLSKRFAAAAALALGASGVAMADDNSMSRFGGDSYAYFNSQPVVRGNAPDVAAWRKGHPNGLTERELQALSSSDLSAVVAQANPQVFSAVAADTTWRQSHPNGLTERELQALSASSLAIWQAPERTATVTNLAEQPGTENMSARLKQFFGTYR
jgi:hypothetical protein